MHNESPKLTPTTKVWQKIKLEWHEIIVKKNWRKIWPIKLIRISKLNVWPRHAMNSRLHLGKSIRKKDHKLVLSEAKNMYIREIIRKNKPIIEEWYEEHKR